MSVYSNIKIQSSGLGLEDLGDLSSLLNEVPMESSAGPLELPLDLIDEDPNQPRTADNPGFMPESIAEIGETIRIRGVKSPISVRENPNAPGRYLINHGARRYRGSNWAGRATIPAFLDNDYNEADHVIENLQRNELTAREIADYIGRELQCLANDGRLALIAVQGGIKSEIDAGLLLRKRLTISGSTLRPRPVAYKTELARALRAQAWPLIEAGQVRPVIHRVFPAAEAAAAHALMESSVHVGKIILNWSAA